MTESAFAIFGTPIGSCAIVWRGGTLVGTSLPERDETTLRARMGRRHPQSREAEPPPSIAALIEAVRRLLAGEPVEFGGVELDYSSVPAFDRSVYEAALAIPAGQTLTYGEMAERIGSPGAARAVGTALGRNPWPIIVPCHRILAAGGRSGGFSAPGGADTKLKLLEIEGARRGNEAELFERLPWAIRPAQAQP